MVGPRASGGTGFSREGVGGYATQMMVFKRALSRLKPVLLTHRMHRMHRMHPSGLAVTRA